MSREKIVNQLVDVFRLYGYDGASLSRIAKVTGLGKTNLYHYFPGGKEEMAEAALQQIDIWLETCILMPLASKAKPDKKLQAMCEQVQLFFDDGRKSCLWAVLALGQSSDDLFHHRIKQALCRWIAAIAQVLEEAGFSAQLARHRAEETVLRIQGALVLARGLNDIAPFQRAIETLTDEWLKL